MNVISVNESSPLEIVYDQGGEVTVFDQTSTASTLKRTVTITNGTKVRWYGVVSGNSDYSLQFVTRSGESIIRMLLLSRDAEKLSTTVHSTLAASNTVTNIHILSLVGDAGTITLNGTVQIDSDIQKVKGHILEENIFLGSKGNIR